MTEKSKTSAIEAQARRVNDERLYWSSRQEHDRNRYDRQFDDHPMTPHPNDPYRWLINYDYASNLKDMKAPQQMSIKGNENVDFPKHEYDVVTLLQIEKGVEMWKVLFPGSTRVYTYKVSQSHTPVYAGAQVVLSRADGSLTVGKLVERDYDFQPIPGLSYQWVVAVLPPLETLMTLPKNDASARLRDRAIAASNDEIPLY